MSTTSKVFALFHKERKKFLVPATSQKYGCTLRTNPGRPWETSDETLAEYVRQIGDLGDATSVSRELPVHHFNPDVLAVVEVVTEIKDFDVKVTLPSYPEVMSWLARQFPIYNSIIAQYHVSTPEEQKRYRYSPDELRQFLKARATEQAAAAARDVEVINAVA